MFYSNNSEQTKVGNKMMNNLKEWKSSEKK